MPPAFGAGPVIWSEGFAYSDGNLATVGSAVWGEPVVTADAARHIRVDTGALAGPVAAGWAGAYTLKSDFGDGDYILPLAAPPADTFQMLIHLLAKHDGEGGITAYTLNHSKIAAALDRIRLQRWSASSVAATLIDDSSSEWVAGDAFGWRRIGSLLSLWRRPSGGSWAQVGADQSDATLTAGRVMVESNSGVTSLDNLEVRSNASSRQPTPAIRRFQHLLVR